MVLLPSTLLLRAKYSGVTRVRELKEGMSLSYEGSGIYAWFPFKQAFCSKLLDIKFTKDERLVKSQSILDPFMGSGNVLVSCIKYGKTGYGVDISPLFQFISLVKTSNYSNTDFVKAKKIVARTRFYKREGDYLQDSMPKYSSFSKLFHPSVLKRFLILRDSSLTIEDEKSRQIILFALVSKLLRFSYAKRYGKGLHIKKKSKNGKKVKMDVKKIIVKNIECMRKEYHKFRASIPKESKPGKAYPLVGDARKLDKMSEIPAVDCVFTSPPYCNSSDYIEMYKLEHWFLNFVTNLKEFKELSHSTIRSHLTIDPQSSSSWSHFAIEDFCEYLETNRSHLWSKRIPTMIRCYFSDLYTSLSKIDKKLREGGTIFLVVGNSSYGGIIVPTDLLLVEAARELGFEIKEILVGRYLSPSSQQKKNMDSDSLKLMRESILVLTKQS